MEQRDRQALEDILGVLDRALEFPISDSQTLEDTTYPQDAVIRCLEVLGEARSLRSLSRTPEAKDLLALRGDWLGCGGDKAIVSALAWPAVRRRSQAHPRLMAKGFQQVNLGVHASNSSNSAALLSWSV